MSAFSSLLTTAAVLVHAVLGCCWHHSHFCEWDQMNGAPARRKPHVLEVQRHNCTHDRSSCPAQRKADDHRQNGCGDNEPHHGHRCSECACSFSFVARIGAEFCIAASRSAAALVRSPSLPVIRINTVWRQSLVPRRALTQVCRV